MPCAGQPPTVPVNVHLTAVTANSVALAWDPATDNIAVTGYTVRQGTTVVATAATNSATIYGLAPQTAVAFTVTASDAAGNASAAACTAIRASSAPPAATFAYSWPPNGW